MRRVVLTPAATRQFKRLSAGARRRVREAISERLANEDATSGDRNRFRLRRVSPHADFELRVDRWRVFYRVSDDRVIVELIGRKKGNRLLIGGKAFDL